MTKYSVKKPLTVLVAVVLVCVLGVISFLGLKTDLLPTIDLPYVMVITTYPGASPEKVELSVTKPLEQALATTNGLENMQSISNENQSIVILEFSQTVNMDSAMIEMSGNIDMVKGYFDDTVSSPMLMKLNPDMLPIQVLSVDFEGMEIKELTDYVKTQLSPMLERIDGVATVSVSGSVEDHLEILLNQEKIDEINDKILKAVNGELYSTKKDLDKAKAELANGKKELETKKEDAFAKLADGSAQLDAGQAQLISISSQADKLSMDIAFYEKQIPLLQSRGMLVGLKQGIELILTMPIPNIENMTAADFIALDPSGMAQQALQGAIAANLIDINDTIATALLKISENITKLDDGLRQMGVHQSVIDNSDHGAISQKLTTAQQELTQANATKAILADKLIELQRAYSELEKAKLTSTTALASVDAELSSAQRELDKGLKEFENARDDALKQANINTLVTQSMINNILQAQNFSMPAGYIKENEDKITVKVGDKFNDIDAISNLLLLDMKMDDLSPIYLKDIADISIKDNVSDSYVRINGNDGIIISLQKSSIASTSQVSKEINNVIKEIKVQQPGLHITGLMDQGVYINLVVDSVLQNLIYGGIIAFIILLLFLKDIRPTIVIGFSIPLSLMFAIVMMYFSNLSLNIISLSGLALGVGMLVDNSIVVIENTYRLRKLGYSKVRAAVIGAKQVSGAIFASTLTTICVFLPIVFTQGLSRQLFTDMGLTIAYSLIASLIVAMTFVPTLASNILTTQEQKETKLFDKMVKGYEKALRYSLKHKWIAISISGILLVIAGYNALSMPMSFIPAMDAPQMQMTLSLPKETTDEELKNISDEIVQLTKEIDSIETIAAMQGSTGMINMGGSSDQNKTISYYVVLKEDISKTNAEIEQSIKEKTKKYENEISITSQSMNMSALGGSGISVAIKGNDLDELQNIATDIAGLLSEAQGVKTVDDGKGTQISEMRIDVDKEKAMKHGLTTAQVYQKVSEALKEETSSTTLTFDGEDIKAVISQGKKQTKDSIMNLEIVRETDKDKKETIITLADIAQLNEAFSPKAINRDNQARTKSVIATVEDGYNVSLVSREAEDIISGYNVPKGYTVEMTGENETIMQAALDLVLMILLAIVFIYLIMVAQFQSLLSPFIILFTIPLAFTGGLLALQITNTELSVVSMIGFLVLAGVVVNNGIVFVDYVNQLRLEGMDKKEALVKAGVDRIRPILMTAITTILAMSTMALGVGMGADMSQGMAIVTIGGLSYATLLTLFLVPSIYDILHRRELKNIVVDFNEDENEGIY